MSSIAWPEAALTPVARARALAAAFPVAGLAETTIDVPFADAWPRLMELERSVPAADRSVRSITVRSREFLPDGAEQLRITARAPGGLPQRFDVRIEDGFCLMNGVGHLFVVVMAAEPDPADPSRTHYVHVESVPRRGTRFLRPLLQREVESDVVGFRRYLES
jgi:hypothetical protein